MHNTNRIFMSLGIVAMAIAMSGCVPALKVSAVGASATAAAVEIPAMVSPPATAALPAVDEIVIVRRGSPMEGLGGHPIWRQGFSLDDNVFLRMEKLELPAGKEGFRFMPAEEQPTFVPRKGQQELLLQFPAPWNRQFPFLNLDANHRAPMAKRPSVPEGIKISSKKQVARIVAFFNERDWWRRRADPYRFATRPGNWYRLAQQPDMEIYFVHNGRVVGSRGLKGYLLWADAYNNSLYQVLRLDEIRELQELGIRHEVK